MTGSGLLTIALLLVMGILCHEDVNQSSAIKLTVLDSFNNTTLTYSTTIAYRGILLGAMRRLQNETSFNFTTTEDPNYGPFLVSVNGIAGSKESQTYWELLAESMSGSIIRPDVGIGCYIPEDNGHVILNFTKWSCDA